MIHTNTVTPHLLKLRRSYLHHRSLNHFRLVGGTAIALQIGHRLSVDVDFFTNEIIDKKETELHLRDLFPGSIFSVSDHSVSAVYEKVGLVREE